MTQLSQKYCYFCGELKCCEMVLRKNILEILGGLLGDLAPLGWYQEK